MSKGPILLRIWNTLSEARKKRIEARAKKLDKEYSNKKEK